MTSILWITEQVTHCFICPDKERANAMAESILDGDAEPSDFPTEHAPLKGEARFIGSFVEEN